MVTEVTHQSFFSRLTSAIFGMLVGLLLVIGGFPVLIWNEGRAVHRAKDLAEGEQNAVEIDVENLDAGHEGKLVFANGVAKTDETLKDPLFDVEATGALKLVREVQMYQWDEDKDTRTRKKLGGGEERVTTYTYKKVWKNKVINSGAFKERFGHENPSSMPYGNSTETAKLITLGAHTLPEDLKSSLNDTSSFSLNKEQFDKIAASHTDKLLLNNGGLYRGEDPSSPKIGDVKVEFSVVPVGPVSLVGIQQAQSFAPYQTSGGRNLYELRMGSHTKESLFKQLVSENTLMTWLIRAGGLAMMFIGLLFLSKPIAVLADVIPPLGSLVGFGVGVFAFVMALAMATFAIAIGWLAYRPLLGGTLVVVSIGLVVFLWRFAGKRKAAM